MEYLFLPILREIIKLNVKNDPNLKNIRVNLEVETKELEDDPNLELRSLNGRFTNKDLICNFAYGIDVGFITPKKLSGETKGIGNFELKVESLYSSRRFKRVPVSTNSHFEAEKISGDISYEDLENTVLGINGVIGKNSLTATYEHTLEKKIIPIKIEGNIKIDQSGNYPFNLKTKFGQNKKNYIINIIHGDFKTE